VPLYNSDALLNGPSFSLLLLAPSKLLIRLVLFLLVSSSMKGADQLSLVVVVLAQFILIMWIEDYVQFTKLVSYLLCSLSANRAIHHVQL
jgi:hypothetical protein